MKHIVMLTTLILTAISANLLCSIPYAEASAGGSAPQFTSPGPTYTCPSLTVQVVSLEVAPAFVASRYSVKAAWSANPPQCFTLRHFNVKVTVKFANGQIRSVEQTMPGTQTTFQGQVSGAGSEPKMADVSVTAVAIASASGNMTYPSGISIGTNCPRIPISITQTVFSGLQSIPNRPGDYHPKVKVVWQVNNLASCITVKEFKVRATLASDGKNLEKTVTLPGNQLSAEVVIDSAAVGSTFTPQSVKSQINASGTAYIEGTGSKKIEVK